MGKRDNMGRKAIDWLKEAYERGETFANTPDIAAALVRDLGMKRTFAARGAADWDRQARYELLHKRVVVTPPVPQNKYRRSASDSAARREGAIATRHKDITTRMEHLAAYHAAAAQQPDASKNQIKLALMTEGMRHMQEVAQMIADELQVASVTADAPAQLHVVSRAAD